MKTLPFTLLLFLSCSLYAQSGFRHALGVQIGMPHAGFSPDIKTCTPSIAFQYERRIKKVSIGFIIAVAQFNAYEEQTNGQIYYTAPTKGTLEIIGLRGNYYLFSSSKADLYAGLMISYMVGDPDLYFDSEYVHTKYRQGVVGVDPVRKSNGFRPGLQLGGHYWFSSKFGAWGELSYGTFVCNLGITLRH